MKDIIIIGGGASGLVAAIYASKSGKQVAILEKNKTCGKKILITFFRRYNYECQYQIKLLQVFIGINIDPIIIHKNTNNIL